MFAGRDIVLVREAFSLGAFLLGPIWFAPHRMWAALGIWAGAATSLAFLGGYLELSATETLGAVFILHAFLGLEHGALRQAALRRRGYHLVDVVEGSGAMEAELVFHARMMPPDAAQADGKALRPRLRPAQPIGLFLQGDH